MMKRDSIKRLSVTVPGRAFFLLVGMLVLLQTASIAQSTALYTTLSESRKVTSVKEKQAKNIIKESTISGVVTDANTGEPMPGVNVLVKGTSFGAATDANGRYELTVETLQDTLRFSFIGYQTKAVPIAGRTTINVSLEPSLVNLEELVVIGFGSQSRRNIVSSVSSVKSEAIEEVHTTTIDQVLQGRVAGVQVTKTSGTLGSAVKVRVRGISSINASSQPLYVIDGLPVINSSIGVSNGLNPLLNLNSNDIESIQVLKGAAAAAIYGSRAANGVVLITTKDGSAVGDAQLSVKISGGYTKPTNLYNLLDTEQYIKIHNYKWGESLNPSDYPNTDWLDLVTRTGAVQNYNVTLTGGNKKTQYYMSALYGDQKGYIIPNQLKKYSVRAEIHHSFNDRLDLDLSVNPSRSITNQVPFIGTIAAAFTMAPLVPPVVPQFLPNGEINNGRDPTPIGNDFSRFAGTPYSNVVGIDIRTVTSQILARGGATYDVLQNLMVKSNVNIQLIGTQTTRRSENYTSSGFPNGSASASSQDFLNYNWVNTFTYSQDIGDHSIEATLGVTFQKVERNSFSVSGQDIPFSPLRTLNSAARITGGGGFQTSYTFQNNVGRISYNYKGRYLLTLTGSYNGTSRFAQDHQYGFFPAIAAGWIISDEDFMDGSETLNFLKLRASYGTTGNASIGNFAYAGLLNAGADYASQPGLVLSQLENPSLTWEKVNQFNVGIDFGLFNNRISGTLAYYNKVTTDLILSVPVSNTNGFTSITKNAGEVLNTGLEFNVSADILTNNFFWNVYANISTINNEVRDLPAGEIIIAQNIVRVGEAIGSFYLREFKGVDPDNGDALYADGNGGTTNDYNAAPRKILGSPVPDFFGGFGTSVAYKGIDFSLNFQYTYGNELYWSEGRYLASNLTVIYNQVVSQMDFWTPNNTDATVPEPRTSPNGNGPSSRYLSDGSYLRLKSVVVGYTIPSQFLGGTNARLYFQGTNLLTLTNYVGLDPETTGSATGNIVQANVNFEPPQSKALIFGIEIKF